MRISNNSHPHFINFGTKLETAKVLEVTSQRIFNSEGIEGCKEVINALSDKPLQNNEGPSGVRYHAINIGQKITSKYSNIAAATEEIHTIMKSNPYISKKELNTQVAPIIARLGEKIDITI